MLYSPNPSASKPPMYACPRCVLSPVFVCSALDLLLISFTCWRWARRNKTALRKHVRKRVSSMPLEPKAGRQGGDRQSGARGDASREGRADAAGDVGVDSSAILEKGGDYTMEAMEMDEAVRRFDKLRLWANARVDESRPVARPVARLPVDSGSRRCKYRFQHSRSLQQCLGTETTRADAMPTAERRGDWATEVCHHLRYELCLSPISMQFHKRAQLSLESPASAAATSEELALCINIRCLSGQTSRWCSDPHWPAGGDTKLATPATASSWAVRASS